jgi:hypothetical protein
MTICFSAVYQDLSFSQFHLDEITPVHLPGLLNWITKDNLHPDFKIGTIVNTDGWGNKLVTIFAHYLDSFIVTQNLSLICQIRNFGSGQILQPRQIHLSPGFAKITPWWLARRDSFSAKVPGLVSADGATNVYSLNRRAVSWYLYDVLRQRLALYTKTNFDLKNK